MRRLRRLIGKHGSRALRLLERPTFRIEGGEFRRAVRELERTSMNLVYGMLIAALIVFAATVSNSSAFGHQVAQKLMNQFERFYEVFVADYRMETY